MTVQREAAAERYHFIVPLWGAKYVDMFVNYSLPSQLAPGNLPSLPPGMTTYEIYTTPEDVRAIDEAESIKKLRALVDVSIKTFRVQDVCRALDYDQGKYVQNLRKMSWCYEQALAACNGVDAAFVFMTPDSIWANGAFRFMHACQVAGVRALMALGLITIGPSIQHHLGDFTTPGQSVIDIPPRQLVKLACDALHPLGIARIVKDGSARWNSAFYWMKPGQGLVARCFYLHPVMVRPRVHLDDMPCTVDYRYVQQACPDFGDIRIVNDSDDLFYIDMAELQHAGETLLLENYSPESIVEWMCEWTDAYHQAYFRQPIVLRGIDRDDDFADELAEAEDFAANLLERYRSHYPVGGRTVHPSNLLDGKPVRAELLKPSATGAAGCFRAFLGRCLGLVGRAVSFAFTIPRLTCRFFYRVLFFKFYQRIGRLETTIATNQKMFDTWKALLIRTEYEVDCRIAAHCAASENKAEGSHASPRLVSRPPNARAAG